MVNRNLKPARGGRKAAQVFADWDIAVVFDELNLDWLPGCKRCLQRIAELPAAFGKRFDEQIGDSVTVVIDFSDGGGQGRHLGVFWGAGFRAASDD